MDLLRTAYLLTGTWPNAEDLVQIALMKAMRNWSRIDDPMAYLRRALANQRATIWSRMRRQPLPVGKLPDHPDSRDLAESVAQRDELLRALAGLPPRMRAVLVLRYWEDLSEADTAGILGCSIGSVKSQASRGLAQLRSVLAGSRTPVGGSFDVG
ncbi:SigE family RNA polymerase sigma factor [Rugosimonospora acidiphila]